jgi:GlcNAc-P-P-Und epimerase
LAENTIIFGGSGFIGKHLSEQILLREGHKCGITIADIESPLDVTNVRFRSCDVRYPIEMDFENSNIQETIIFNLAAVHRTPGHEDLEYFETNIRGAENVCDFARQKRISTIVFTSSIAPYGASEDEKYEDQLPMPNTPYGISKMIAEEIHKRWQAEDPLNRKLIIARPGVVFGSGEKGNFTRLYKAIRTGIFFFPGRKETLKASIYVKDLTRIFIEMTSSLGPGAHLYNCCYPAPHSIEEICDGMSEIINARRVRLVIPSWILTSVATILYLTSSGLGLRKLGIHPDRVKKLRVSTNISGQKLQQSGFIIQYSLVEALDDWYKDNNRKEMK